MKHILLVEILLISPLRIKRGNPEERGRRRALKRAEGMMERKMIERQCLHFRKEGAEREAEARESPYLNPLALLSTRPGKEPVLTQSFPTQKAVHRAN